MYLCVGIGFEQVHQDSRQGIYRITQQPQSAIAAGAEQPSNMTLLMAVVDIQIPLPLTDGTTTTLVKHALVVLLDRQPVRRPEVGTPRLPAPIDGLLGPGCLCLTLKDERHVLGG